MIFEIMFDRYNLSNYNIFNPIKERGDDYESNRDRSKSR
jgi:hypothetical protein